MLDVSKQSQLQSLVQAVSSVIVVVGPEGGDDAVAAGLGLAAGLQSLQKTTAIISPTPVQPQIPLTDLNKIQTEISPQHALISFAYSETAVDKVSYAISDDNSRFTLTIKPKAGHPPLDLESIKTEYAGASAELVILVGAVTQADLGPIFEQLQALSDEVSVIAVSHTPSQLAALNLTTTDENSLSQMVASILFDLGVRPSATTATNLLSGIEFATQHFQSPTTTPETFEIVARLLRAGGQRPHQAQKKPQNQPIAAQSAALFASDDK
jgi:nanoRNase/pAp phosphatase (c-di-AMP/oligoRNAs hydrolase)